MSPKTFIFFFFLRFSYGAVAVAEAVTIPGDIDGGVSGGGDNDGGDSDLGDNDGSDGYGGAGGGGDADDGGPPCNNIQIKISF